MNAYYPLKERNYYEKWSPNQPDSRYSTKNLIKIGGTHPMNYQTFQFPLDYHNVAYPLTIKVSDAFPSININKLPESPQFSRNENEIVSKKPKRNDENINQDLSTSKQHSDKDTNTNQVLKSKLYDSSENDCVIIHEYKKYSHTNRKIHLHTENSSAKEISSNLSINSLSPAAKSSSNEHLESLSSEFSANKIYSSTAVSLQLPESDPEIVIIKDLHQPVSISVKIEGLYSPKKLIRKEFHPSSDLCSLMHQNNKAESYKVQNIDPIIHELSPNDSNVSKKSKFSRSSVAWLQMQQRL